MRIAVPVVSGKINQHYGQTKGFRVFTVEGEPAAVTGSADIDCGDAGCGGLALVLRSHAVEVVLVGGIGEGALRHLQAEGIQVLSGVAAGEPQQAVEAYLAGALSASGATCAGHGEHGHGTHHGHGHGCHCHGKGASAAGNAGVKQRSAACE